MEVSASSGKYSVISSGLVLADDWDSDIGFHVQITKEMVLNIKLKFEEKEGAGRDLEIEAGKDELIFKCINFSDSSGTAFPIEIGTFLGEKLFFNFRNYGEKNVMRKVEYTFFTEK